MGFERPIDGDSSNIELQNESNTGKMGGIGSGGIVVPSTRMQDNPANFHRGLFALMSSFNWDEGKFDESPDNQALKAEAMDLLKLPPHLSSQFTPDKMSELLENIQRNNRDATDIDGGRSADYVRNLIKLSQARFKR